MRMETVASLAAARERPARRGAAARVRFYGTRLSHMNLVERLYDRAIGRRVFGRRVQTLCGHLSALVPEDADILDVGCGNGLLAHLLQQRRPDITVHGIDVRIARQSYIAVEKFDGSIMPFGDGS